MKAINKRDKESNSERHADRVLAHEGDTFSRDALKIMHASSSLFYESVCFSDVAVVIRFRFFVGLVRIFVLFEFLVLRVF